MLNGLYGLIFGTSEKVIGEEIAPNTTAAQSSNSVPKTKNAESGDWILVNEDVEKLKTSAIDNALIDECQSISSSAPSMTASWSETESGNNKSGKTVDQEKLKQKMDIANSLQQRQWLTKMLFSDPATTPGKSTTEPIVPDTKLQIQSENRMKKANKAEHVQSQAKIKQRSKKQGAKSSANRNNDRKCNNIA